MFLEAQRERKALFLYKARTHGLLNTRYRFHEYKPLNETSCGWLTVCPVWTGAEKKPFISMRRMCHLLCSRQTSGLLILYMRITIANPLVTLLNGLLILSKFMECETWLSGYTYDSKGSRSPFGIDTWPGSKRELLPSTKYGLPMIRSSCTLQRFSYSYIVLYGSYE